MGRFTVSNVVPRLSISCFFLTVFAIKSQSLQRTINNRNWHFWAHFYGKHQNIYGSSLSRLFPTVWQSLIEFHSLTSVREACQWSRMQNLRRAGINSGPLLSRLWTEVHEILGHCRRPFVASNARPLLSVLYFVPNTLAVKLNIWIWMWNFISTATLASVAGKGHAFWNRTHFWTCGSFCLSSGH